MAINNMLGVIIGHTELALDQMDPAQPRYACLQEIRKAADRSTDLTRQLLAFTRKQTVAPRVAELNDTVEGMFKKLVSLYPELRSLFMSGYTGNVIVLDCPF